MTHSTARTVLACFSAGLNAVLGGSVFMFGILAKPIGTSFHFSQAQLSSIALAGVAGQYPLALVVGKFLDTRGPRPCSAIAALLFGFAFAWCSWEVHVAGSLDHHSNGIVFVRMVLAFLIAGIATVFSCFSAIFSASIALPSIPGFAFGLYMSLFGLSPLFLSLFPPLFTKRDELQLSPFFAFLAILLACSHAIGAFLLPSLPSAKIEAQEEIRDTLHQPVSVLLKDHAFWILFCEMVMANIGSIVYSLSSTPSFTMQPDVASRQVGIISVSNTASRVIMGVLIDLFFRRRHLSGRVLFLTFAATISAVVSLLMVVGEKPESSEEVWPLSLAIGVAYGTIFTTL
ncbi:major facilitator superfamily domain-containing protein [Flagelloscypha sp. PMI_526]|nr:major facilitator superfamily domain-containing protein [Flagelloscypha sp. PMI_526]